MATSAYKDPVEIQDMIKIIDNIITGFFIIIFGILWYCSAKYYLIPNQYTIIIYDIFGKEVKINEIRTNFKTQGVAYSYLSEYQKRFKHYSFSINTQIPEKKKSVILKIFKKN